MLEITIKIEFIERKLLTLKIKGLAIKFVVVKLLTLKLKVYKKTLLQIVSLY